MKTTEVSGLVRLPDNSDTHLLGYREFDTVVAFAELQDLVIGPRFLFPELLFRLRVNAKALMMYGNPLLTLQGNPKTSRPCGWYLAYRACKPGTKSLSERIAHGCIGRLVHTFIVRCQSTSGGDVDEQDRLALEIFQGYRPTGLFYLQSRSVAGHTDQFMRERLTLRSYKDIFEVMLIVLALDRAEDTTRVDLDTIRMLMLDRSGRTDAESRPDCYPR